MGEPTHKIRGSGCECSKTPSSSLDLPWKTHIALSVLTNALDVFCSKICTVNLRRGNIFDLRAPPKSKSVNCLTSHDVVVDPARKLWFRVYMPTQHASDDLPVMVFFHGGRFVSSPPDFLSYDAVCHRFVRNMPVTVVSVNYRLAAKHKNPTQHDDCFDVLKFLDDEENRSRSIPANANTLLCFLAGDSGFLNLIGKTR